MTFHSLNRHIVSCERCPRLIEHCREIARTKRKAFVDWEYWGRPVGNFGVPNSRLLIVGLAPAAHGANRTGRMFTGDRSGDWLYRAMYKAGFANQPTATARDDGLELIDATITAAAHCAPPGNKPSRDELENCQPWLSETIDVTRPRVLIALGQIAFKAVVAEVRARDWLDARPAVKFSHGGETSLRGGRAILSSYHPSQQNTFTGRLTEPMFDRVFDRARQLIDSR